MAMKKTKPERNPGTKVKHTENYTRQPEAAPGTVTQNKRWQEVWYSLNELRGAVNQLKDLRAEIGDFDSVYSEDPPIPSCISFMLTCTPSLIQDLTKDIYSIVDEIREML